MRFALTGEQTAMQEAVRQLLATECSPDVVRAAWAGDPLDRLWRRLAEMGVPGALVPEEDGGLGLADVHLAAVLTEVGYAAAPLPVHETAAVAAPLLVAAGDPGGHLAGIIGGTTRVALVGPTGLAPYAQSCDLLLALHGDGAPDDGAPDGGARVGGVPGGGVPGGAWLARRDEVDTTPVATVDGSRGALRVRGRGRPLPVRAGQLAQARDRDTLGIAAQLVGLGRRMLDLTVDYVRERRQFGVPVGSFQAVKHRLADALLRLEFAEPAVLRAAWASEQAAGPTVPVVPAGEQAAGPTAPAGERAAAGRGRDVAVAYVLAVEAATAAAQAALQCHGAMGYTVEYDLHLYAKRVWALAAAGGTVDAPLARIAAELGVGR